jgi:hypothetical protein
MCSSDGFCSAHRRCRRKFAQIAELTLRELQGLFGLSLMAVHIPQFYPLDSCERLARKFEPELVPYGGVVGSAEVLKLKHCVALYEGGDAYFDGAADSLRALREISKPEAPPACLVRTLLDDLWPYGAMLMRFDGRKGRVGLVRGIPGEARPHVDNCGVDRPDIADAKRVIFQISWNLYLQKEGGGQLEIWDFIPTPEQVESLRVPGDYGLDRTKLGPPDIVIDPQPGDLVLFNARAVHAVRRSVGRMRLAQSGFIGFRGPMEPLGMFS